MDAGETEGGLITVSFHASNLNLKLIVMEAKKIPTEENCYVTLSEAQAHFLF